MIRKAIIFPSRVKMMTAFHKFKDDNPNFSVMYLDLKIITPNNEIFFFYPENIGSKMRGNTFHEVVIVEKLYLTREEMGQLQMTVVPTGGSMRSLK